MWTNFISEASNADRSVSYVPTLSIEWVREVEESDGITDFPDNSCAMPTEVTVDHNGARGKRRGLISLITGFFKDFFSEKVHS